MPISDFWNHATQTAREQTAGLFQPTVRLGVTGLSRAGKTVFITALVNRLMARTGLPGFEPLARGAVNGVSRQRIPHLGLDIVPFRYERHLERLLASPPTWPDNTKGLSQIRIDLDYTPESGFTRLFGERTLHLDIIDYPGEWLLDLPLLNLSFYNWAQEGLALAGGRKQLAAEFIAFVAGIDPTAPHDDDLAHRGAELFRAYLKACRDDNHALSTLPPGRFLLPGEHEGKLILDFFPLDLPLDRTLPAGSLGVELVRRYRAYCDEIVTPFYRNHFARLDTQIVLVDLLGALNTGQAAINDLKLALEAILKSFRIGRSGWFSSLFAPKIDRILFAATKADHLLQDDHQKLTDLIRYVTEDAAGRAEARGVNFGYAAIAAVRATREAEATIAGRPLACLRGIPMPGERIGKRIFDGIEEAAIFPGRLPDDPVEALSSGLVEPEAGAEDLRFVRFRPPAAHRSAVTGAPALPHIGLGHALDFLIGDRLR